MTFAIHIANLTGIENIVVQRLRKVRRFLLGHYLNNVQNDAAVYLAFFQPSKNRVDGLKRLLFDCRLNFALRREGERFLKILSRPNN